MRSKTNNQTFLATIGETRKSSGGEKSKNDRLVSKIFGQLYFTYDKPRFVSLDAWVP